MNLEVAAYRYEKLIAKRNPLGAIMDNEPWLSDRYSAFNYWSSDFEEAGMEQKPITASLKITSDAALASGTFFLLRDIWDGYKSRTLTTRCACVVDNDNGLHFYPREYLSPFIYRYDRLCKGVSLHLVDATYSKYPILVVKYNEEPIMAICAVIKKES